MTAQLLEYTSASDLRVRRVRAAFAASPHPKVAPHRGGNVIRVPWGPNRARACDVTRTVAAPSTVLAAPAPTRLVWTPRGIAVMVVLVALMAGLMLTTAIGSFLSVSNAPFATIIGG